MLTKLGNIVCVALLIASVVIIAGSYIILWQRVEKLHNLAKINKEADLKVISYNEEVITYNNVVSKRNTDLMLKQKLER